MGPLATLVTPLLGVIDNDFLSIVSVAIPASTVDRVADQLLATGRIPRGYLGLSMQPVRLPAEQARALGINGGTGVIVLGVEADAPGDRAGVMVGDIIATIGGAPVRDVDDVLAALGPESVGRPLTLGVVRGGGRTDLTLTVEDRPRGGR
jgi:S1-C subfamily serine protease